MARLLAYVVRNLSWDLLELRRPKRGSREPAQHSRHFRPFQLLRLRHFRLLAVFVTTPTRGIYNESLF